MSLLTLAESRAAPPAFVTAERDTESGTARNTNAETEAESGTAAEAERSAEEYSGRGVRGHN